MKTIKEITELLEILQNEIEEIKISQESNYNSKNYESLAEDFLNQFDKNDFSFEVEDIVNVEIDLHHREIQTEIEWDDNFINEIIRTTIEKFVEHIENKD